MTARALARIVAVAVAVGLLALLGALSGAAAAWAVPVGVAVSVLGRPPVAPRALTTLAGGAFALLVLGGVTGATGSEELGAAATVAVLMVAAGLLTRRDDPRAPSWAVLLGGATVLAGARVAGASALADVAPALGGLLVGILPMQVGEIVAQLRRRRDDRPDRSGRAGTTLSAVGLLLALTAGLLASSVPAATAADRGEPGATTAGSPQLVEAELDDTGEVVEARLRRHERPSTDGEATEHVEPIAEDRIPVAVRIRYELDGEQVTAEELRGSSGRARVRVLLRNPTAEPRTVTAPDGGDGREVELSLPLVAEGLLELDDSWRDVRSDAGRLAPAEGGATQLRWASTLFEPFARSTAVIEVEGEVDGARLPRLEIDARPVSARSSDLLRLLERRATDEGTADAVAAFIADNLGDGLSGAAEGADGLADGLAQARGGAGEIRAGLEQMQEQLGGGLGELAGGLSRLDEGLARVAEGLERVEEGLTEVAAGIDRLGEGVGRARAGAERLGEEVAVPAEDAVREAWRLLAEEFTVGRLDPAYVDAVMTVGELHALLTGEVPATDDLEEPPGDDEEEQEEELAGLLDEIARLTDQQPPDGDEDFDGVGEGAEGLEDYPGLAASLDELAAGLEEASEGAGRLGEAAEGLTAGVAELRGGVEEMRAMLSEAVPEAGPGSDADPEEMEQGLAEFERAMERLAEGGDELAGGLQALGRGGDELLTRLEEELARSNLDLASVEALSERASEDVDDERAAGGHDRYLLVFDEVERSGSAVPALTGLGMLGLTLEVLRRRLTAT